MGLNSQDYGCRFDLHLQTILQLDSHPDLKPNLDPGLKNPIAQNWTTTEVEEIPTPKFDTFDKDLDFKTWTREVYLDKLMN